MEAVRSLLMTVKELTAVGVAWKMMLILWVGTTVLNLLSLYSALSISATTPAEYLLKWRTGNSAIYGLGVSALGIAITVTSFKESARWAWFVMWCYPATQFFVAFNVFLMPPSSLDYGVMAMGAASVVVLLLPVKQVFAKSREGQSEATGVDKKNPLQH